MYRIQRFQPGHKYYSDKIIIHEDKEYRSVFGQIVDANGVFIHYTLERLDTLIAEGEYQFDFYYSNANKCTVPRLISFEGKDISSRELEHHIANYAWNLKGCTAHGMAIDTNVPMLLNSGVAFNKFMTLLQNKKGTFIYEKLNN